ncbi:DUF6904 family protein [Desulfoscipio gibsoniae]
MCYGNRAKIKLESDLQEAAKIHKCSVSDLRLNIDYPEDIEW